MPRTARRTELRPQVFESYRTGSCLLEGQKILTSDADLLAAIVRIQPPNGPLRLPLGIFDTDIETPEVHKAVQDVIRAWAELYTTIDAYPREQRFRHDPMQRAMPQRTVSLAIVNATALALKTRTNTDHFVPELMFHQLALLADAVVVHATEPHGNAWFETCLAAEPASEQRVRTLVHGVSADGTNLTASSMRKLGAIESAKLFAHLDATLAPQGTGRHVLQMARAAATRGYTPIALRVAPPPRPGRSAHLTPRTPSGPGRHLAGPGRS